MAVISLLKTDEATEQQPRQLKALLQKLLLPFGGSEVYFDTAHTVFLLDLLLPADNAAGVNFDLRLAYALAELARGRSHRLVSFAVRPEEGFGLEQVLEASGYDRLRELENVDFIDLSQAETLRLPTDTRLALDEAPVYRPLAEAGLVVSLAKLKAAENSLFGSAMCNLALAGPGLNGRDAEQRSRALVDIYSVLTPDLTLVDGWRGDSGFQQHRGDFVLAAADAVAADAVLAALSGIDLAQVDYLQLAAQYGLGEGDPGSIHLYGDDISELMN
ncbi:MAG: DUF362 domain-containing protein [Firmicutes bacterium]|nr:DUF362 domain-containing protein [Bacillota bacterium]